MMGCTKFCGHMKKFFTLTLYINKVVSLDFIRLLIASLYTQNTIFFFNIYLDIHKRFVRQIWKAYHENIECMSLLDFIYTCYGEGRINKSLSKSSISCTDLLELSSIMSFVM
jgi:hypothetical protein